MARDVGNGLIYGMLHRRLTIEALANVMGLELATVELPGEPPAEPWHALYDSTLDNLQVIVPRIDDPLASQWTKGVARVLKYLKEIDRSGRGSTTPNATTSTRLLGTEPATVADGRRALERATSEGAVRDEDYVAFLWRQVQRDDHLMRTASGALHDRTWPPLTDAGAG